jgi:hypothetical protein
MSLEIVGKTIGGTSGDLGLPQTEEFATDPTTSRGWTDSGTGSPTYGGTGMSLAGTGTANIDMDTISAKKYFSMTFDSSTVILSSVGLRVNEVNSTSLTNHLGTTDLFVFTVTGINLNDGTWKIYTGGAYFASTNNQSYTGDSRITTITGGASIKIGAYITNTSVDPATSMRLKAVTWL